MVVLQPLSGKSGTVQTGGVLQSLSSMDEQTRKLYSAPVRQQVSQPQQQVQPVSQKKETFAQKATKFGARTAVNFADLLSESLDFTVGFIVDNPVFNLSSKLGIKTRGLILGKEEEKKAEQVLNKWKNI